MSAHQIPHLRGSLVTCSIVVFIAALVMLFVCTGCAPTPRAQVAPSAATVRQQVSESRLNISAAKSQVSQGQARSDAASSNVGRAKTEIAAADAVVTTLEEANPQFHTQFAELKFRFRVAIRELEAAQAELVEVKGDLAKAHENLTMADTQLALADARAKELQAEIDVQTLALGSAQAAEAAARNSASKAQTVAARATGAAIIIFLLGAAGIYAAWKFF